MQETRKAPPAPRGGRAVGRRASAGRPRRLPSGRQAAIKPQRLKGRKCADGAYLRYRNACAVKEVWNAFLGGVAAKAKATAKANI